MAQQEKNIIGKQLIHSYLSSVISISLVLFLVGMTSLLVVNANQVSDYFREHIGVTVVLTADSKDADSTLMVLQLKAAPYAVDAVKQTSYISREEGKREMSDLLGSDFLSVFETNPLPASIELRLRPAYVQKDSLEQLTASLMTLPYVEEVTYQAPLVEVVNRNIEKMGMVLAAVTLVLLLISISLIHNTIQLSVYARRFTIYTMRLVGATRRFIRKPFMGKATLQGLIAGLIAVLLLLGVLLLLQRDFPGILMLVTRRVLLGVMGGMVFLGIFLCRISTFFVVNKVARADASSIYY